MTDIDFCEMSLLSFSSKEKKNIFQWYKKQYYIATFLWFTISKLKLESFLDKIHQYMILVPLHFIRYIFCMNNEIQTKKR